MCILVCMPERRSLITKMQKDLIVFLFQKRSEDNLFSYHELFLLLLPLSEQLSTIPHTRIKRHIGTYIHECKHKPWCIKVVLLNIWSIMWLFGRCISMCGGVLSGFMRHSDLWMGLWLGPLSLSASWSPQLVHHWGSQALLQKCSPVE